MVAVLWFQMPILIYSLICSQPLTFLPELLIESKLNNIRRTTNYIRIFVLCPYQMQLSKNFFHKLQSKLTIRFISAIKCCILED